MPMKNEIQQSERGTIGITICLGISLLLVITGLIFAFFITKKVPVTPAGGFAQKIIYVHVPFAIGSFVAFFVGFVCATVFLWKDNSHTPGTSGQNRFQYLDAMRASVEVGFLFSCVVLLTGPLWAKPVWGVFWRFEPRLNTFAIMWIIYAIFLVVPPFLKEERIRQFFQSVWAIIGFFTIPMVYLSVKLIPEHQQLHPSGDRPDMDSPMTLTIFLMMAGMIVLFVVLSHIRYETLQVSRSLKRKKRDTKQKQL